MCALRAVSRSGHMGDSDVHHRQPDSTNDLSGARSEDDPMSNAEEMEVGQGQIVKFYDAEPIGPGRYAPPRVTVRSSCFSTGALSTSITVTNGLG